MEVRTVLTLSSIFILCSSQPPTPCPESLTVDISTAQQSNTSSESFLHDGLIYDKTNYFISENGTRLGCVCNVKTCIRKCCPMGMSMQFTQGHHECHATNRTFQVNFHKDRTLSEGMTMSDVHVAVSKLCLGDHLDILKAEEEGFIYLQENGSLYYVEASWQPLFEVDSYCIDDFDDQLSAYLCDYIDPDEEIQAQMETTVNGVGLLVSMPFLICTFLVYVILPERNLHRYALMCYIISLLAGNTILLLLQFYQIERPPVSCQIIGYSIIFFYLVSFAWLNALCIDMSLAFSSWTGFLSKKTSEKRKFLFYSVYAWGAPMLFALMVILLDEYMDKTSEYHPNVGEGNCFVKDGYPKLLYFYLPMTVLVIVNIAAFVYTFCKIYKIKKETKMLKRSDSRIHTHNDDKQKFNLYLKLLFAMGLNWSMEIISWLVLWLCKSVPRAVFYVTDFTNATYGIIIFLIFVFKKKIIRNLQKRLNKLFGRPQMTPRTSAKSSRTNYSDTILSTTEFTSSSASVFRQPECVPLKQR